MVDIVKNILLTPKGLFAEFLSEGLTVLDIRKRMGLTEGAAGKIMKQIRDDLGVPVRD